MGLDFFKLGTKEHLFCLESSQYSYLEPEIFTKFQHWTGIYIDEYGDTRLSVANQKALIKIIDEYIERTDLNKNKAKTKSILEFRGLLSYFISRDYSLELFGD